MKVENEPVQPNVENKEEVKPYWRISGGEVIFPTNYYENGKKGLTNNIQGNELITDASFEMSRIENKKKREESDLCPSEVKRNEIRPSYNIGDNNVKIVENKKSLQNEEFNVTNNDIKVVEDFPVKRIKKKCYCQCDIAILIIYCIIFFIIIALIIAILKEIGIF